MSRSVMAEMEEVPDLEAAEGETEAAMVGGAMVGAAAEEETAVEAVAALARS